jgi:hypothetical protein
MENLGQKLINSASSQVLLPGFHKGKDIKDCKGKRMEAA